MADFAAVLRKTIDALKENTPEMRARVYDKARATIDAKLAAVSPPPSDAVVQRQKQSLENAIAAVEAEYAAPAAPAEESPSDDLESIFAELKKGTAKVEPVSTADTMAGASQAEPGAADEPQVEPEPVAGPAAEQAPAVSEYGEAPPEMPQFDEPEAGEQSVPAPEPLSDPDEQYADRIEGPSPDDDFLHHDGDPAVPGREEEHVAAAPAARRGNRRGFVVLAILLAVLAGTAFAAWQYRDDAAQLAGYANFDAMMAGDSGEAGTGPETADPDGEASPVEPEEADSSGEPASNAQQPAKFTQRLTPDGQEIDEGPAGGNPGLGEGTSVAEATQPGGASISGGGEEGATGEGQEEPPASGEGEQALPVGQRAIFYEERTSAEQGTADTGSVVWSLVEESPGDNLPPEPAIHAEATIPDKNIQLKMTIRRNADQSLPASHIVELIFLTPENFAGGGVKDVLRFSMKRTEQDTGSALIGSAAKIADGFFLVALSDGRADRETNALLMRRQSWIDIPITYTSGRRALITMEKGVPGERIFNEALDAWAEASSASGG
ncbi:hypothetical protein [Nitratireductor luteus]|uniref:hypothetical protein n=1 Tax=Nitratireductor luteus TaxID=2976980 RepID=UPI0022404F0E|nr:hypothetical protein [Nitratireductor luteus]